MVNLLHLQLNDNDGTVLLKNSIPAQRITLKQYRLQFLAVGGDASDVVSLANPIVYLSVPWIGSSQVHSNNQLFHYLPLLNGGLTGEVVSCDISFDCHKQIDQQFNYQLLNASGVLIANTVLANTSLIFEYDVGVL